MFGKFYVWAFFCTAFLNVAAQEAKKADDRLLVDAHDKQEYKTVKIGAQLWTAENLKYRPAGSQKVWCYGDDEKNCEKYGVLYGWEAAIEACPQGWRMPSAQDWNALQTFLETDAKANKQTDEVGKLLLAANGFNASFGGFRLDNGRFALLGSHALFWSNEIDTEYSEPAARFGRYFGRHLYQADPKSVKFEPSRGKADAARSLRCIQIAAPPMP